MEGMHRFAWDGFSFLLPADWNMAGYRLDPKRSTVFFEDDIAVRLEMEWVRSPRNAGRDAFLRRYAQMSAELEKSGARAQPIDGLPGVWAGKLHVMPDKRLLSTAYGTLPAAEELQVFLRLHFDSASLREPPRLLRRITETFQVHESETRPWEVFDVAFEIGARWRLVETAFQAGLKLFVLTWRARRLWIWFCSLADHALRGRAPEEWAAAHLRTVKALEACRFLPEANGRLRAVRRRRYPLGHVEEISRWCFHYRARCVHEQEQNRLVLSVLQYRQHTDIAAARLAVQGLGCQGQSFFGYTPDSTRR